MTEFIILADDLTGANDTGVQFAKWGYDTVSLLDADRLENVGGTDVLVINGETRSLSSEKAYLRTRQFAEKLPFSRIRHIYKKIDSTMRGNIGAEIDALMDALPFDVAVVAPAYPQTERVTLGGYHLVRGVLLDESEIASDPKCPVKESFLPALLSSQSKRSVGHVDLRMIRGKNGPLSEQIWKLIGEGRQILLFDTLAQHDLSRIVSALRDQDLRVLWVGSAGLALSLCEPTEKRQGIATSLKVRKKATEDPPVLVVAGSVSPVTRKQIDELIASGRCCIVSVDPVTLLENAGKRALAATQICGWMEHGLTPVLTTDVSEKTRVKLSAWMEKHGKDPVETGNLIAEGLGNIVSLVMGKREVCGLVLTGGDVAYRTCKALGAAALKIVDEVEEGLPLSVIIGGQAQHIPVVTKAGAFGRPVSLVKAVQKLKNVYAG